MSSEYYMSSEYSKIATTLPPGRTSDRACPAWLVVCVWIFALLFPLLALSRQSFWIDEAITGNAASQPSLTEWWRSLKTVNGSDVQMPFYMVYVWAWEKLFGRSELALRFANYPWFVLGQVAAGSLWRDRRKGLLLVTI